MVLAVLASIREKALNGKRLGRDEGRWLLTEAPLLELGALANEVRFARIPDKVVTFVIDSNPNYTNVCVTDCQFCAFYRKPGDPEAYTLTVEEVLAKVAFAAAKGATTILLQGGHNPALPLDYYTSLVRETRRRFPAVTPHFFTASEIQTIAQVSRLTVGGVLDRLSEAGQRTLPGGGAEVLSERVRQRIAPKKGGPSAWLEVHREAHRRGFKSTATMMYGHVEQPDDLLDHLDAIRELQDEWGGFTAFVPWSFKPGNTLLERWIKQVKGPNTYLRMLAVARVYLDNFPHIQASWFSEGKPTGQIALHFGADDWGGTLFEENVHKAAAYVNTITVEEITALIREVEPPDVDAGRERQAGLARPHLAEVEHLHEPHPCVGDLALVDQEPDIGLALEDGRRNLVEGHLDQRRVADVEAQKERRGRVAAGDRYHLLRDRARVQRLTRHEDRPVALPHRGARIHHPVPVGDEEIRREGDRGHLELGSPRAAVQRLDVLEHVLDPDARDPYLPRRKRVEHERVVGIGAVADSYRLHPGLRDVGLAPCGARGRARAIRHRERSRAGSPRRGSRG